MGCRGSKARSAPKNGRQPAHEVQQPDTSNTRPLPNLPDTSDGTRLVQNIPETSSAIVTESSAAKTSPQRHRVVLKAGDGKKSPQHKVVLKAREVKIKPVTKTRTAPHEEGENVAPPQLGELDEFRADPLEGVRMDVPADIEPLDLGNGYIYRGEWKKHIKEGVAEMTHPNGGQFVGEYRNDQPWMGRYKEPDGRIFEGDFQDGIFHNGKYTFRDGTVFWGTFKCNKRVGRGKEVHPDGSSYVGDFKNNQKHGKGIYTMANGQEYYGQFSEGRVNGVGTWTWPEGMWYYGKWKDNTHHGEGLYVWPNGRFYRGNWENNNQSGEGIEGEIGGTSRKGFWQNGVRLMWLSEPEPDYTKSESLRPPPKDDLYPDKEEVQPA